MLSEEGRKMNQRLKMSQMIKLIDKDIIITIPYVQESEERLNNRDIGDLCFEFLEMKTMMPEIEKNKLMKIILIPI